MSDGHTAKVPEVKAVRGNQEENFPMLARAIFICLIVIAGAPRAESEQPLSVSLTAANELVIVVSRDFHERYGCAYPMTYQIDLPTGMSGLKAQCKYGVGETWREIPEKTSNDYFNGIDAVRFDYALGRAYVSAAFASTSDTLMVNIINTAGAPVAPRYAGVSKYYDNRSAVVTITADDWADWSNWMFPSLLAIFRSYRLPVTAGVITRSDWCSPATWDHIQRQVDSGLVEIASHSRTHPHVPYADLLGEIEGSHDDITSNLSLIRPSRVGGREYVYVWIAPYGEYGISIDTLLSRRSYLVPRLYAINGSTLSGWRADRGHFQGTDLTLEIGAPSWGGGTTDSTFMNGKFDAIVRQGGIYHLMWHPQVIYDDRAKPYLHNHLSHISSRKDLWYVNFGYLYLYQLLAQVRSPTLAEVVDVETPTGFELYQNYPNPFNPTTTISFSLPISSHVKLNVYDLFGREVATLVDETKSSGQWSVRFDVSDRNLSSGVYFCRIETGGLTQTKGMVFMK